MGGLLCACIAPPPPQPTPDEIAEEIIVLINGEREAQGLEPFVVNEHLMLMAKWRSQDMVDGDYYSHTPVLATSHIRSGSCQRNGQYHPNRVSC